MLRGETLGGRGGEGSDQVREGGQEKKRTEGIDHKLEATFELQKKKHDEAEEKFKKALDHPDEKE